MKAFDRILAGLILTCGLILSVFKAGTAPITTDEAWNYNQWISAGFKTILTDYSAFNNHILQTALSRISILILGDSEFAQRYPSILAYILFAFVLLKLIESTIQTRTLRLLCFTSVILHPYIIDFSALARGYMLMTALNTTAVYFIVEAFNPLKMNRRILRLALASCFAGWAAATVPSSIRLLPAFLMILLIKTRKNPDQPATPAHLGAIIIPAVLIIAAFYLPAVESAKGLSIELGAGNITESMQSLQSIFFYTPPGALNAGGNPVMQAGAVSLWKVSGLISVIHNVLAGKTALILLSILFLTIIILPFRFKISAPAMQVHLIWLTILGIILIERYACGSLLPYGRTWFALIPFPAISAFALLEKALTRTDEKRRDILMILAGLLISALIIIRISGFNVISYHEWPDNHAAPDIVNDLDSCIKPGASTTVASPLYYNACLKYYANRVGLTDLSLTTHENADANFSLLREDLLEDAVPAPFAVSRYPGTTLVLTNSRQN